MNPAPTALVIGAGIGGLSAAADLARAGWAVTVLERAQDVGGKMRRVPVADTALDAGPTVLTMRWVFDRLFERCGSRLDDAVTLRPQTVLARHGWADGAQLDLFLDRARSEAAIEAFAGPENAAGYRRFCEYARAIYQEVEGPFIRSGRPTALTLLKLRGPKVFQSLKRIDSWRSLWAAVQHFFPDPRLQQLFGRYATYTGSSPFEAPATLNLIAHVEQEGVWQVAGGIHGLARALQRLAEGHGATFRFGAQVAEVLQERGRATGVRLADGEVLTADAVVLNADRAALSAGLFGERPQRAVAPQKARSLSALTWCLVAPTAGFPLEHHNVFFSDDYPAEFSDLFGAGRLPRQPTIYVCAQDRGAGETPPAPGESERLFVLVNAPAVGDTGLAPQEIEACEATTFEWLTRCGLTVHRRPQATVRTTPTDFEALFPATGGALYGAPTHGWRASLSRPGARTKLPGLYLAGGGVHPGAGVPMVSLSGQLAAQAAIADRAS